MTSGRAAREAQGTDDQRQHGSGFRSGKISYRVCKDPFSSLWPTSWGRGRFPNWYVVRQDLCAILAPKRNSLCALALTPYRQWPLYIFAALPAHVVAELGVGMGWPQMWVAFATNTMVATLNAFGVRYLLGGPPWFDSLHKVIVYILITVVCGSAVSALGGAFVRITGAADFGGYWLFWAQWYVANALACLTLVPMLLTWLTKDGNWEVSGPRARRAEAAVLLAGLAARAPSHSMQPSLSSRAMSRRFSTCHYRLLFGRRCDFARWGRALPSFS